MQSPPGNCSKWTDFNLPVKDFSVLLREAICNQQFNFCPKMHSDCLENSVGRGPKNCDCEETELHVLPL